MIPHAPPMRFELDDEAGPHRGSVRLPSIHPLLTPDGYPTLALLELAAQLAGRSLAEPRSSDAQGSPLSGMLVELESVTVVCPIVPPGATLVYTITSGRCFGELHRIHVELHKVMSVSLTLRIK